MVMMMMMMMMMTMMMMMMGVHAIGLGCRSIIDADLKLRLLELVFESPSFFNVILHGMH